MRTRVETRTKAARKTDIVTSSRRGRRDAAYGIFVAVAAAGLFWAVFYFAVIR